MKKETLQLIHDEAMVCADFIKEFGSDRKYEWKLYGYLACMCDLGYISYVEKNKIELHYRAYFKELKTGRNQS